MERQLRNPAGAPNRFPRSDAAGPKRTIALRQRNLGTARRPGGKGRRTKKEEGWDESEATRTDCHCCSPDSPPDGDQASYASQETLTRRRSRHLPTTRGMGLANGAGGI